MTVMTGDGKGVGYTPDGTRDCFRPEAVSDGQPSEPSGNFPVIPGKPVVTILTPGDDGV